LKLTDVAASPDAPVSAPIVCAAPSVSLDEQFLSQFSRNFPLSLSPDWHSARNDCTSVRLAAPLGEAATATFFYS
jgi:hypothetical protein